MCSVSWFPLLCPQVHWFIFLYNLIYFWSCECIFNFSYYIFTSAWFFIIFSTLNFLQCSSILFPSLVRVFIIMSWNLYCVDCLSLLHLVLFLKFCSLIENIFFSLIILPNFLNFCVLGRSVMFLRLWEAALYGRCPVEPRSTFPPTLLELCILGGPPCGLHMFLYCGRADYCGHADR